MKLYSLNKMQKQQRIQLWDMHDPILIADLFTTPGFFINVNFAKPSVPEDVEARVNQNWKEFSAENPSAKDNDIAYLVEYENTPDAKAHSAVTAGVFTAGYKYSQYLNRDDKEMKDSAAANALDLNPLASWIIAICSNGKYALFGNKIDFGNKKVSGFGGFTSPEDIVERAQETYAIDVYSYLQRVLKKEMKGLGSAIGNMYNIGLNYFSIVGPKGFDGVYIVELEGTPEQLQRHFSESSQFSKQLIPVHANPESLLQFVESKEWEPTWSCIGGVLSYIGVMFGEDELNRCLGAYSKKDLINIFKEAPAGKVKNYL